MSGTFSVGLVGARGHAGRELLRLIASHPELRLAFASSRELAGRPVAEVAPEIGEGPVFAAPDPQAAARRGADAVVLALPDGAGAPFVAGLEAAAPETRIVDLSADRRFDDGWVYGLPERNRAALKGARRIANPGCYATAVQLAVAPLLSVLGGTAVAFGVSGYSGAGTTPSPRNDPARLADSLMPYRLTGHTHEAEATRHLGAPVRFMPHVHPAFRGLTATVDMPLRVALTQAEILARYEAAYADEPLVALQADPPELRDAAHRPGAIVGGVAVDASGRRAVAVAALDNLLKGAATQAVQNLNLALGLPEFEGLGV